jgi:pimeloyl-ACP methyl ester carboxylesterase
LLHAGVADRRSWYGVVPKLVEGATVVAYDRRGFGETEPSTSSFSHVEDMLAVLGDVTDGPAWLVGSSAGGRLALDAALVEPARVTGLVLLAPAVSGAPDHDLDADTERFDKLLNQAAAVGDLEEINRLETWLWLDGPAEPEGRVPGPARELLRGMNAIVLRNGIPEHAGASGVDAWGRLGQVKVPATVACGDRDVPFLVARSRELAERLPNARHRVLPGMAHLPYLEQPEAIAELVTEALGADSLSQHRP